MAFWGVELKAGKPHCHRFDRSRGRLHLSQATLGIGPSQKKSFVQCTVGDKSPILLCSLIPDKAETCPLDFEFAEDEEVVFSVLGPRSVHLGGYYLDNVADFEDDSDESSSDSYGMDIGEMDSEQSADFEDDYEDDFIVDNDDEMFQPPPRRNSGVVIEEILDDEKTANGNGDHKSLKNKHEASDSDGDDQKEIIVKGRSSVISESEDEDGFPVSLSNSKDGNTEVEEKSDKKVSKGSNKNAEDGGDQVASAKKKKGKRKNPDGETERETEKLNASSLPSLEAGQENLEKPKKKKKKERTKEGKTHGDRDDKENEASLEIVKTDGITQEEPVNNEADEPSNDKIIKTDTSSVTEDTAEKKKKKKKNKKNKTPESDVNANTPETKKVLDKEAELKPTKERSYANGLVVEELEMGKPDGKRASPGNKVSLHYIGKLKKNGKLFDSNIRGNNAPFVFRLGVGQVIKGWDVGVNGMRVGDKRRLTIPPSMGYGAQGAGQKIPPNAWLVFDVELVAVG